MVSSTPVMGANDNLSAISILQALGEEIQINQLNNWNVKIIAFGAEEPGRYGSKFYVKKHRKELTKSIVLNIDMVGIGNQLGLNSKEAFINVVHNQNLVKNLVKIAKSDKYLIDPICTNFGFTDAASFSQQKIPATTLFCYGGQSNFWHLPSDTSHTLNESSLQLFYDFSLSLLKYIDFHYDYDSIISF